VTGRHVKSRQRARRVVRAEIWMLDQYAIDREKEDSMKNTLLSSCRTGLQPILGALTLMALLIGLPLQHAWAQTKAANEGTWPGSWDADSHIQQTNLVIQTQQEKAVLDQCGVAFKAHQYARALSLCQQAAATGNKEAIEGLAIVYRDGLGQCSKAAVYYNMNKDTRPGAASGLGEMYWLGCPDFQKDYRQARSLLESAARRGFINALEDLAWMDELGQGAPQNRLKAIQELRGVASHGNEWPNDVMIALQQRNAPARFNSEKELGSYAADVRFSREMARLNQEDQRRLEAERRNAPPGTWLYCSPILGCHYVDAPTPLQQTLSRVPGSPWNH